MSDTELMPCPFCGSTITSVEYMEVSRELRPRCGCGARGPYDGVAAWNTRARVAPKVKKLEWEVEEDLPHLFDAIGVGVLYRVIERHNGTGSLRIGNMNVEWSSHKDADSAKEAAQDHHEKAILSALDI